MSAAVDDEEEEAVDEEPDDEPDDEPDYEAAGHFSQTSHLGAAGHVGHFGASGHFNEVDDPAASFSFLISASFLMASSLQV